MNQYMLDTNIFGDLVEGVFGLDAFPSDAQFWATPVHWEEIKRAPGDVQSRFKELILDQETIVPAGFAFDIPGAGWNQGEWRQDGRLWYALKRELDDALEKRWGNQRPTD